MIIVWPRYVGAGNGCVDDECGLIGFLVDVGGALSETGRWCSFSDGDFH